MLCSILVFSVPADWSHDGKVLYAYATYIALNICYSFVNIPYGSLATVMTQDPRPGPSWGWPAPSAPD